ncbi:MAG: HutD family protein [Bacteroidetes bacterium]|nr:HutD family protein [Bacteroidota bacterium]
MKVYKDFKTAKWSGGTTTELFIYPPTANFKKGDYSLRLSLATIDKSETVFTPKPDVERHLMVLNGPISLSHNNKDYELFAPFRVSKFKGDDLTKSKGIGRVLNLMFKQTCQGQLEMVSLAENQNLLINQENNKTLLFSINGNLLVKHANHQTELNANQLAELTNLSTEIKASSNCSFIIVRSNV